MIITKLIGGLGNQMFQYAAGLATAERTGAPLYVDTTALRRYTRHQGYQFPDIFTGPFQEASQWDLFRVLRLQKKKITKRGVTIDPTWRPNAKSRVIQQNTHNYWPEFDQVQGQCYLEGYWQSSKYFANATDKVRAAFRFKNVANPANQSIAAQMRSEMSVSVHIRRGDYVTNANALKFHGICEWSYYDQAIQMLEERLENPKFYIFSDDPALARGQYPDPDRFTVIDINRGADSYRDMELMTMCKHHIIANSSFSWWGAWLADHPKKIVIAPSLWSVGSPEPVIDIYEPNWLRLP